MEGINVGDYIRTMRGNIGKFKDYSKDDYDIVYFKREGYGLTCVDRNEIIKHRPNIIDLLEDEDIVILEYKSPKYRERITRRFEVSKIDDDIRFENAHCNFHCKVGDKKITDKICKNIRIKSIVTKEQFNQVKYEV